MKNWLKKLFSSENKERSDENKLNNHSANIIQVDTSIAKKQKETRKHVDNQLKIAHKFASIPHEPTCPVFHPTNPNLDCHGQCNYDVTPDKIIGKSYVIQVRNKPHAPKNGIKELDARLYEDEPFNEFDELL